MRINVILLFLLCIEICCCYKVKEREQYVKKERVDSICNESEKIKKEKNENIIKLNDKENDEECIQIKDTMYVFSSNWSFINPIQGIRCHDDFKRCYNRYRLDSFYIGKSDNDTINQYLSEESYVEILYDEDDEDEDEIYNYIIKAKIKDKRIVLCDSVMVGMDISNFFDMLKIKNYDINTIDVICLVTLLDYYIYVIDLKYRKISEIDIFAYDYSDIKYRTYISEIYKKIKK